jgi:hypothetical protein
VSRKKSFLFIGTVAHIYTVEVPTSFPRAFAFPFFGTKNSNRHFLAVGAIQIVQCAEPWPSKANALNESSHNLGAPLLVGKSKSTAETE